MKKKRKMKEFKSKEINLFIFLCMGLAPAILLIFYGADFFGTKGKKDLAKDELRIDDDTGKQKEVAGTATLEVRGTAYHRLKFKTTESNYTVRVNGRKVIVRQNSVRLPARKKMKVVVSKEDHQDIIFFIDKKSDKDLIRELNFQKLDFGYLTITSSPGADITLQSKGRNLASIYTPMRKRRLPVGTYEITIENDLIGYSSKFTVTIKKGETTRIHKDLQ